MDAVSGKKAPEGAGSVSDHTFCQPCANDGKNIPPDAFCTVRKEFMCSTCARVHRNMKFTKSHALQDKSNMPSSFHADREEDEFTETCQLHAKEFIKYYCPNHKALLCGDCVVDNEEHQSCKVKKVSQLAKRYKEGAEYNSLKKGIMQMVNDIENYSSYIEASMKSVNEENITNINELRQFRHEINQLLDKREKELLEEIDRKKRESMTLLNELTANCQDMRSATEKLKAELIAHEVNNNQLFVSGTRALKEFVGLLSAFGEFRGRRTIIFSKFIRDPASEKLFASCTTIGRVEQVASDLADQQTKLQGPGKQLNTVLNMSHAELRQSQFSRMPDIPVNILTETSDCILTSMALLPGVRLLLTDCRNNSVKLVDTPTNKVVSQVKLPGQPWDLCLLPGDRAAITLPMEGKIQFVSTKGNVTLQNVVEVNGTCRGIDFIDHNLIVSFSYPGKVVLMDMKGKVKKSVDNDSSGKPLFQYSYYLTVTRDSHTPAIYVSHWDTNAITKLSISLEVLQSFKDPILRRPYGLTAVGDNQLLVCGWDSDNIMLLDTFTRGITKLLGKEEDREATHCGLLSTKENDVCQLLPWQQT